MSYINITTLKSRLTPKLHGANLNKVVGSLYDKFREAAATVLLHIDPPSTVYYSRIDNALYDKIYNYTCPAYLKNPSKIIDIRPISIRNINDEPVSTSGRSFDVKKDKNNITVETISGVKTLRINNVFTPPQKMIVDFSAVNLDSTTPTVTASGDASAITQDYLDYITGNASMSFTLSGSTGQGVISVTLPTTFDLSELLNFGSIFEWFEISDGTRMTNVKLRWGSSDTSSNYWEQTVTIPQGRTAFDTSAWDLLNNTWTTATKTGSPDSASIKYLQFIINYTTGAALTAKLDSVTASLGRAYEVGYYDSRIFKDASSGALKEIPTTDSDLITLDETALNIYIYECLRVLGPELKGRNMASDMAEWKLKLYGDGRMVRGTLVANEEGWYRDYISQNASNALPPQESYYDFEGSINQDEGDSFRQVW